jgi:hypothetical protein
MFLTKIQTHCKKQNAKTLENAKVKRYFEFRPPSWTSDAILNITKNLSSMKYVRLKYKLKSKNRTQKCPELTELWL